MYPILAVFLLALSVCSQAAFARPREVKMDQAMHHSLNLFFSNFSEARVPPFERGKITDRQLLEFGVMHRILDGKGLESLSSKKAPFDGGGWRLAKERVSSAAAYYFGHVPHAFQSVKKLGVSYRDGYFYGRSGEGETYDIARVTRLTDLGGGFFRADVDIDTPDSPNSDLAKPWEETATLKCRMQATIQQVAPGGSRRFILVAYRATGGKP